MNAATSSSDSASHPWPWVRVLSLWLFTAGVMLLMLGQVITFYPGAERNHYALCAVLVVGGVFSRVRWVQFIAVLLFFYAVAAAKDGQQRGLKYQERLKQGAVMEGAAK